MKKLIAITLSLILTFSLGGAFVLSHISSRLVYITAMQSDGTVVLTDTLGFQWTVKDALEDLDIGDGVDLTLFWRTKDLHDTVIVDTAYAGIHMDGDGMLTWY